VNSTRKELLNIITVLSKTLSNLTDEEFNKIISNSAKLSYVENEMRNEVDRISSDIEINDLAFNIKQFDTREKTQKYIEDLKLTKEKLLAIGKLVNANMSKKDNKKKIIEKIIDATVGAKLRLEAISKIDLSRKK